MSKVQIASKSFSDGTWSVYASIVLDDATRCGSHCVELPEEATEEEIGAAILAMYEPPAAEPAPKKAGKK